MTPRPLWIICNARTGSTYLCELLNALQKFPTLKDEAFIPNHADFIKSVERFRATREPYVFGPNPMDKSFAEWLKVYNHPDGVAEFKRSPLRYSKITYPQWESLFDKPLSEIKEIPQGIQFVYLYRRDKLAHAASKFMARSLNKRIKEDSSNQSTSYQIYAENDLNRYNEFEIKFDRRIMFQCYYEVLKYNNIWEKYVDLNKCLSIAYEDLTTNPEKALMDISDFHDLRLSHSEISEAIAKFNEKPAIFKSTRTADFDKYSSIISRQFI